MRSIYILIVLLIMACLVVLVGVLARVMHWSQAGGNRLIVAGLAAELLCAVLLVRAFWKRRVG